MERQRVAPREDYRARLESQGLSFHSWDDYWREDACYRFSLREVEEVEAAAEELHQMCLHAVDVLLRSERLGQLGIPELFWVDLEVSFRRKDFDLYGRFDLAYDGQSPPKLLEYNADTPTSLLESAVCQWHWLEDVFPQHDQFNSLHERIVERWKQLSGSGPIHLASIAGNEEDWVCTTYLMDTVLQAGCEARQIDVEAIGWDAQARRFVDREGAPIERLFKLYPWEWMMREEFGRWIGASGTRFIEPMWKAALSCKGILPILWELFPGHPNLVEAHFEAGRLSAYARKPLYSREGANVELVADGRSVAAADGPYGGEGYVYQALAPLPRFEDRHAVVGAWLVGGQAAGMCVREDVSPITTNMSNFVPHYFVA
ncbi:MAG TPA: glutathionylspermidine synthase family protein [Rhodocyclaceae bacterium]